MKIAYIYDLMVFDKQEIINFIEFINELVNETKKKEFTSAIIFFMNNSIQIEEIEKKFCGNQIEIILTDREMDITLQGYCEYLLSIIREREYDYIFLRSSVSGRNISSWLGKKLKAGVIADAVNVDWDEKANQFCFERCTNERELISKLICTSRIKIATIRALDNNCFDYIPNAKKEVNIHHYNRQSDIKILERIKKKRVTKKNNVVIGIGRGVSDDCYKEIKLFADDNGILIMGSKTMVENGKIKKEQQIGQSGKVISADLYIAVGISGAIQHVIGILDCKKIMAINNDRNAPIHEYADYSIIYDACDVFKLLNGNG